MRVAIIVSRIEDLGPVKVIQNLVNSLLEFDDLRIKVFYIDKYVDPDIEMVVPVERLYRHNFNFTDFDIVHTNGIRPDFFAFINRKKIRYHISTVHNLVFDDLKFTYNRIISWLFGNIWLILWKRADKLVCVSQTMKCYYSRWFPSSKLEVIYNGISVTDAVILPDDNIVSSIFSFHLKGLKVIGTAGVLTRRKGIDQILYLLADEKELALVIIGNGKEVSNLKRISRKLKITDRCLFCGFVSNAVSYFRSFDLFAMPSRSEGFGLALIEAVQQKVPVICSDIPVFKELFNQEEVTFFKLDNLNSLEEAVSEALIIGSKKVELAFLRYHKCYTDTQMSLKYLELYQSA